MTKASDVMEKFMKKLENRTFEKENPQMDGLVFEEGFAVAQLMAYSDFLDSNVMSDVLAEEKEKSLC